ncbi:MAG: hypothetical protein V4691_04085 [Pseudomonadota bacterium]
MNKSVQKVGLKKSDNFNLPAENFSNNLKLASLSAVDNNLLMGWATDNEIRRMYRAMRGVPREKRDEKSPSNVRLYAETLANWIREKNTGNVTPDYIASLNNDVGGETCDAFGSVLVVPDRGFKGGQYKLYGFGSPNDLSSFNPFLAEVSDYPELPQDRQDRITTLELTGINGMLKKLGKKGVGSAIEPDTFAALAVAYMNYPTEEEFIAYIKNHRSADDESSTSLIDKLT